MITADPRIRIGWLFSGCNNCLRQSVQKHRDRPVCDFVACDKRQRRHTTSVIRCACALLVTPYRLRIVNNWPAVCKRTAAPSGISVHQRHPAIVEFSPWRFFFLHERVVCGRRGLDAHPCGRGGCDQDGWQPRCRAGGNGSRYCQPAERRALL